jgi:hypothetical protein
MVQATTPRGSIGSSTVGNMMMTTRAAIEKDVVDAAVAKKATDDVAAVKKATDVAVVA